MKTGTGLGLRTRRVGTRGITNRVAHAGWQGKGVLGISHGATDTVPRPSRISLLPMDSGRGQATVLSQRSRRSRSCTPALVRTNSQLERMFTVPPALFRADSHTGETEKISTSGQKHEQMQTALLRADSSTGAFPLKVAEERIAHSDHMAHQPSDTSKEWQRRAASVNPRRAVTFKPEESLAEKTLLLALSALLDTKSTEARVWKGIRPEYGNNPMMKKEASMESSRNPNPTSRHEAQEHKLWGGRMGAAPGDPELLSDHNNGSLISMTLRQHLTECGVNVSQKEEQELRSIWPDAKIMCNKMSHAEFADLLKTLQHTSTAAKQLHRARLGGHDASPRGMTSDTAPETNVAATSHRMKELLYTSRHPHVTNPQKRQIEVTRYKNKLEEMKRLRHDEVVSTTKKQEKEQDADEFNQKMKTLQQKIYAAKVEVNTTVLDPEKLIEIRNRTIQDQTDKFDSFIAREKHKEKLKEEAHVETLIRHKKRYAKSLAEIQEFEDNKRERLLNGLRAQKARYDRDVRKAADEYLLHPSEPRQHKEFMHDVESPSVMPLPKNLKPKDPHTRKARKEFDETDHDCDSVISDLGSKRDARTVVDPRRFVTTRGAEPSGRRAGIESTISTSRSVVREIPPPPSTGRRAGNQSTVSTSRSVVRDVPPAPSTGRRAGNESFIPTSTGRESRLLINYY